MRFALWWGIVLQLGDDLQDVRSDRRAGSRTLYTQCAGSGEPLDRVTNRTFHFGSFAMQHMAEMRDADPALADLLKKSARVLLIRSAAGAAELYTPAYLRELEPFSPFGFDYMQKREDDLARRKRDYAGLFERLIACRGFETSFSAQNIPNARCFNAVVTE